MKISRKPEFDENLTIIENIFQQRKRKTSRDYQRYQFFRFTRILALIALAYWGYATRHIIQDFIIHLFTNPKLLLP